MCWNKEVSITTFILAIIGSVYLYQRNKPNDRWVAVFAATIAFIQLAEFLMWSDLECGTINRYASMLALLVLAMEPFMNMVGGIYFSNTPHKPFLKYLLLSYLVFLIFYFFTQIYQEPTIWCGTSACLTDSIGGFITGNKCNLEWYFLQNKDSKLGVIWILFLMIPFLTMTPHCQGIALFALGFATFFLAKMVNNAALGSLWCWLAVLIIFVKILMT